MSFDQLVTKVRQAENALEAQERHVAADWRQLKASWRAAWTPGRILVAGMLSGFLVGRAQPLRHVSGGGSLQLLSALAGLFAGGSAQAAAGEAEQAVDEARQVAGADGDAAAAASAGDGGHASGNTTASPAPATKPMPDPVHDPHVLLEALRRAGLP